MTGESSASVFDSAWVGSPEKMHDLGSGHNKLIDVEVDYTVDMPVVQSRAHSPQLDSIAVKLDLGIGVEQENSHRSNSIPHPPSCHLLPGSR